MVATRQREIKPTGKKPVIRRSSRKAFSPMRLDVRLMGVGDVCGGAVVTQKHMRMLKDYEKATFDSLMSGVGDITGKDAVRPLDLARVACICMVAAERVQTAKQVDELCATLLKSVIPQETLKRLANAVETTYPDSTKVQNFSHQIIREIDGISFTKMRLSDLRDSGEGPW